MDNLTEEKLIKEDLDKKRKDFEAKQNLLGFFNLFLQIDRRNNPEKYKKPKEKND